jgi:hypothetical protein
VARRNQLESDQVEVVAERALPMEIPIYAQALG